MVRRRSVQYVFFVFIYNLFQKLLEALQLTAILSSGGVVHPSTRRDKSVRLLFLTSSNFSPTYELDLLAACKHYNPSRGQLKRPSSPSPISLCKTTASGPYMLASLPLSCGRCPTPSSASAHTRNSRPAYYKEERSHRIGSCSWQPAWPGGAEELPGTQQVGGSSRSNFGIEVACMNMNG